MIYNSMNRMVMFYTLPEGTFSNECQSFKFKLCIPLGRCEFVGIISTQSLRLSHIADPFLLSL